MHISDIAERAKAYGIPGLSDEDYPIESAQLEPERSTSSNWDVRSHDCVGRERADTSTKCICPPLPAAQPVALPQISAAMRRGDYPWRGGAPPGRHRTYPGWRQSECPLPDQHLTILHQPPSA